MNQSNCHDKEIKDKSSQPSESQNSSNDSTNNRHKCSAARTEIPHVLASPHKCLVTQFSEQFKNSENISKCIKRSPYDSQLKLNN